VSARRAMDTLARSKRLSTAPRINVTPLIDVVMVLIVFFLMVGHLVLERPVDALGTEDAAHSPPPDLLDQPVRPDAASNPGIGDRPFGPFGNYVERRPLQEIGVLGVGAEQLQHLGAECGIIARGLQPGCARINRVFECGVKQLEDGAPLIRCHGRSRAVKGVCTSRKRG